MAHFLRREVTGWTTARTGVVRAVATRKKEQRGRQQSIERKEERGGRAAQVEVLSSEKKLLPLTPASSASAVTVVASARGLAVDERRR